MKIIRISGSNLELIKDKPISSIATVYGMGRVRSKKIASLLLTNPKAKEFRTSLITLAEELKTQRIFKSVKNDNLLKSIVFDNLERLARISSYRAHRILQGLPSKGQRTHTNAGTPNRLNPFSSLGVKLAVAQDLLLSNKRWELNWNNRSNDLTEVSGNTKSRKYNKAASLAKKKKLQEKDAKKKKKK